MNDIISNLEEWLRKGSASFWSPPDLDVVEVNFDRSFIHDSLVAGVGVLMCKDDGSFLLTLVESDVTRLEEVTEC